MRSKSALIFCIVFILTISIFGCGLVGLDGLKPGAPVTGSAIVNAVNTPAPDGALPITLNLNLLANIAVAYVLSKIGYNKGPALLTNIWSALTGIFTHPNDK